MAKHLLVVLGAGASLDCASPPTTRDMSLQPPLATQLFEQRFASILHRYPLAETVAPDVRVAVASGSIALREVPPRRASRLKSRASAPPLPCDPALPPGSPLGDQQPIHRAPRQLRQAYHRGAGRLDRVTIVRLNYDTILDSRLEIENGAPFSHLRDYVNTTRNWSLVKLHGSVNWGRRVLNDDEQETRPGPLIGLAEPYTFVKSFAALGSNIDLEDEVVLRPAIPSKPYGQMPGRASLATSSIRLWRPR